MRRTDRDHLGQADRTAETDVDIGSGIARSVEVVDPVHHALPGRVIGNRQRVRIESALDEIPA